MQVTGHHRPEKLKVRLAAACMPLFWLRERRKKKRKEAVWDQKESQLNLCNNADCSMIQFPHILIITDSGFLFFHFAFLHSVCEPVVFQHSSLLVLQCKTVGVCLRWRNQIHLCEIFRIPATAKGKPVPLYTECDR